MKLVELFLNETTEEDRAIISLSSAISKLIQQYETNDEDGDAWKNKDYADDMDNDEFDDMSEVSDDKPLKIGKIGQLFNTPLEGLNNINIELQSDYGIRIRQKKEGGREIKRPEDELIYGLWYGASDTIVLNRDFIGSNELKTVVSHELRHALDDIKSNYQANKDGGSYSVPQNKDHRKDHSKDPYATDLQKKTPYLAEPAEINARFLEILHLLVPVIRKAASLPNINVRDNVTREFLRFLKLKNIAYLFPEKEKSRDYKRLIKRGMDFIEKEIAHLQK